MYRHERACLTPRKRGNKHFFPPKMSNYFCNECNSSPVICKTVWSAFSHASLLYTSLSGCSPLFAQRAQNPVQQAGLWFRHRNRAKSTSSPDKTSWNQNPEISLNQITSLQNQIGLCYQTRSPLSYGRWIRLITIWHATHAPAHNIFILLGTKWTFPKGLPYVAGYQPH